MAGILAVVNPCTLHGAMEGLWQQMMRLLPRSVCLHTVGDGADRGRIAAALAAERPSLVIAAGGDGTVRAVAAALLGQDPSQSPALAIAPLGTGNNVARGLGLRGFRQGGEAAMAMAVAAIAAGRERHIDVGSVGGEIFIGSFAAGMDGAILALRNRWRRTPLGARLGGYPLYLLSCAANVARWHPVRGRVADNGAATPLYNVVVTNTALYAGEFRFEDGGDHSDDGQLDVNVFTSAPDYVREFVVAWRRHIRHSGGASVGARREQRRVAAVHLAFDRPVPAQVDGEELPRASEFHVEVLPQALRMRVS